MGTRCLMAMMLVPSLPRKKLGAAAGTAVKSFAVTGARRRARRRRAGGLRGDWAGDCMCDTGGWFIREEDGCWMGEGCNGMGLGGGVWGVLGGGWLGCGCDLSCLDLCVAVWVFVRFW